MTLVERILETEDYDSLVKELSAPFYVVKYLVFSTGNRPYGGGGWSRRAKYRPAPEVVSLKTDDVVFNGKSVFVRGVRRLRLNVWQADGTPIRIDYPDLKFESDGL